MTPKIKVNYLEISKYCFCFTSKSIKPEKVIYIFLMQLQKDIGLVNQGIKISQN